MFQLNVVSAGHVRHYCVTLAGEAGWEITVEEDQSVRSRETHGDWHRVERCVAQIQREVSELLKQGWRLQPLSR